MALKMNSANESTIVTRNRSKKRSLEKSMQKLNKLLKSSNSTEIKNLISNTEPEGVNNVTNKLKSKNGSGIEKRVNEKKSPGKETGGKKPPSKDQGVRKKRNKRNYDDTSDGEYYPYKLKRKVSTKKVVLQPKPTFTVVAATNKRKLGNPTKAIEVPQPKKIKMEPAEFDEAFPSHEEFNDDDLTEEDFMEILTCPSPVWWEDQAIIGTFEDPTKEIGISEELSETVTPKETQNEEQNLKLPQTEEFTQKRSKLENVLGNIKSKTQENTDQNPTAEKNTRKRKSSSESLCYISEDFLKQFENIDIPVKNSKNDANSQNCDKNIEVDKIDNNDLLKSNSNDLPAVNEIAERNDLSAVNEIAEPNVVNLSDDDVIKEIDKIINEGEYNKESNVTKDCNDSNKTKDVIEPHQTKHSNDQHQTKDSNPVSTEADTDKQTNKTTIKLKNINKLLKKSTSNEIPENRYLKEDEISKEDFIRSLQLVKVKKVKTTTVVKKHSNVIVDIIENAKLDNLKAKQKTDIKITEKSDLKNDSITKNAKAKKTNNSKTTISPANELKTYYKTKKSRHSPRNKVKANEPNLEEINKLVANNLNKINEILRNSAQLSAEKAKQFKGANKNTTVDTKQIPIAQEKRKINEIVKNMRPYNVFKDSLQSRSLLKVDKQNVTTDIEKNITVHKIDANSKTVGEVQKSQNPKVTNVKAPEIQRVVEIAPKPIEIDLQKRFVTQKQPEVFQNEFQKKVDADINRLSLLSATIDQIKKCDKINKKIPKELPKLIKIPDRLKFKSPKSYTSDSTCSEDDTISDANFKFIDEYDKNKTKNNKDEYVTIYKIIDNNAQCQKCPANTVIDNRRDRLTAVKNKRDTEDLTKIIPGINIDGLTGLTIKKVPMVSNNSATGPRKDSPKTQVVKMNGPAKSDRLTAVRNDTFSRMTPRCDSPVINGYAVKNPFIKVPNSNMRYCLLCSTVFETDECLYCLKKQKRSSTVNNT